MLINNSKPTSDYRHNYIRLGLLVGTLLLFIGHIVVHQLAERGNNRVFPNTTLRTEDVVINDITPSEWVYRSLDALNYLWQLAWLFYSLTFIYRRSTSDYLYLAPNTLTPKFYAVYLVGFLVQTFWLLFFYRTYLVWTWIIYLISFLFLSLALFIINNNLGLNHKVYQTEGFHRDIWCLRFLAQNGVAFFAAWTALRFVLAFETFLQLHLAVSILNAGTICLVLAGILAAVFFFGPNFNATLTEQCSYQFSPWIVFILFFWGVVDNNWVPNNATRNNIIALIELIACLIAAVVCLVFFTIRYRRSAVDVLP